VNALFSEPAIDVALAFDGSLRDTSTETILVTQESPYVFWITPDGELKCRVVGTLGGMTLAASGCTKVAAVRSAGGGYSSVDFGLCVFFLLGGALYYRQLIDLEWSDAVLIAFGPQETWVDVAAYRTLDYRIVLQCLSSTGKVYELFTQYQGFAKRGAEHIRIAGAFYQSQLTEIHYLEGKLAEHMEIVDATLDAPYGGLYAIGTPVIVNAYNIEDPDGDWGKIAVFVFDKHLVASEVAAQRAAFSILDNAGRIYTPRTATLGPDGKTVTLTFINFNRASGICQARYTAGTVTTMAGETLVDTSYAFTPQNLVPPSIPAPEPMSIENVATGSWAIGDGAGIKIRFTDSLMGTGIGDQASFVVSWYQYDFVPNGTLIQQSYAPAAVYAADTDDSIIIEMPGLHRFCSAVGQVTVTYDGTGSLSGASGPVEAFAVSFTPTGLVPKPNQNDQNHIEIAAATKTGVLTRIYYTDTKTSDEHLSVSATWTGVLTHIDDL
jgi:hypothetical protein